MPLASHVQGWGDGVMNVRRCVLLADAFWINKKVFMIRHGGGVSRERPILSPWPDTSADAHGMPYYGDCVVLTLSTCKWQVALHGSNVTQPTWFLVVVVLASSLNSAGSCRLLRWQCGAPAAAAGSAQQQICLQVGCHIKALSEMLPCTGLLVVCSGSIQPVCKKLSAALQSLRACCNM